MKKKYIILLSILLIAGIFVASKWHTWFINPPEAPYTTPAIQDRIFLSMGENSATTRKISWRCDSVLKTGRLEIIQKNTVDTLRIPAQGKIIRSRSGKSAFYNAEITGLMAGSTYHYRLVNDTVVSGWHSFTMPASQDSLSFLYLGDIQDPGEGNTDEFFKRVQARYPDVDFWALGGDVIERPTDAYWTYWFGTMDSIPTFKPLIVATGNHEYLKGLPKTLDPRWTYNFSFPQNGPRHFEGRSYYVNFQHVRFIVIDTDGIQGPKSLYDHYLWLEKTLSSATQKWKIIMMHHPVYSVRAHRDNLYIRYTFKSLMEKYGVNLVLQGHDHGYSRITTRKGNSKKCPVYVVSSCSPKRYSIGFSDIHDRLGSNLCLYQHITIQDDTLHYRSYTEEHKIYDDLKIICTGKDNRILDNAVGWPEHLELPPAYLNSKKVNQEKYRQQVKQREAFIKQRDLPAESL